MQALEDLAERRNSMFGPGHPATLDARLRVGIRLLAADRIDDTIHHFERLRDASRWIPGDGDSAAFAARLFLAVAYAFAARPYDAVSSAEELIAARTAAAGPGDRSALAVRHVTAIAYSFAGRLDDAVGMLQTLASDQTNTLGADHRDTLTTRCVLAARLHDAGRVEDAIGALESVTEDQRRVLGDDHHDTLLARMHLARFLAASGRTHDAATLHGQLIADQARVLGAEHPDTLEACRSVADAYLAAGRFDEVVDRLGAILDQRPQEPPPVDTGKHIPEDETRRIMFESPSELAMFGTLFAEHLRRFGPDDPSTLHYQAAVAIAQVQEGHADEALEYFESQLPLEIATYGASSAEVAETRRYLALCRLAAGRIDETITWCESFFADYWNGLGPPQSTVECVRRVLGAAYATAGVTRSETDRTTSPAGVGEHPPRKGPLGDVALRILTAFTLAKAGEHRTAIAAGESLLIELLAESRKDRPELSAVRNVLWPAYREAELAGSALSVDDVITAWQLDNLSADKFEDDGIYEDFDRTEAAIAVIGALAEQYAQQFGPTHIYTLRARLYLAVCLCDDYRSDEASPIAEQVLVDQIHELGAEHPEVDMTRRVLADAYLGSGGIRLIDYIAGGGRSDLAYSVADYVSDGQWDGDDTYRYRPLQPVAAAEARLLNCITDPGSSPSDVAAARRALATVYDLTDTAASGTRGERVPSDAIGIESRSSYYLEDWDTSKNLDEQRRSALAAADNSGHWWQVVDRLDTLLLDRPQLTGQATPDINELRNALANAFRTTGRPVPFAAVLETSRLDALRDDARLADNTSVGDGPEDIAAEDESATAEPALETSGTVDGHRLPGDDVHVLEDLVAERKRTLGPDHRDTLSAQLDLATAYRDAGHTQDAIETAEALVVDIARVHRRGHADTHRVRAFIADLYRELGYV